MANQDILPLKSAMLSPRFKGSRLKIERAEKHIMELILRCTAFNAKDFHSLRIEEDPERHLSYLCVDIDWTELQVDEFGPIIGDVTHNLRSALDLMHYQLILASNNRPNDWCKFPIFDTPEALETQFVRSNLKQQQVRPEIAEFIRDTIKPYQAGNPTLWGLHQLSITDKHEVLIPTLQLMGIFNFRLEDEGGKQIGPNWVIADENSRNPIRESYRKKIVLKDKGQPSSNIMFNIGCGAFEGEAVVPALTRIAEEVSRTLQAFEKLGF